MELDQGCEVSCPWPGYLARSCFFDHIPRFLSVYSAIFITISRQRVFSFGSSDDILRSCKSEQSRLGSFIRFSVVDGSWAVKKFQRRQHFDCQFSAHQGFISQGVRVRTVVHPIIAPFHLAFNQSNTSRKLSPIDAFVGPIGQFLRKLCCGTKLFSFTTQHFNHAWCLIWEATILMPLHSVIHFQRTGGGVGFVFFTGYAHGRSTSYHHQRWYGYEGIPNRLHIHSSWLSWRKVVKLFHTFCSCNLSQICSFCALWC